MCILRQKRASATAWNAGAVLPDARTVSQKDFEPASSGATHRALLAIGPPSRMTPEGKNPGDPGSKPFRYSTAVHVSVLHNAQQCARRFSFQNVKRGGIAEIRFHLDAVPPGPADRNLRHGLRGGMIALPHMDRLAPRRRPVTPASKRPFPGPRFRPPFGQKPYPMISPWPFSVKLSCGQSRTRRLRGGEHIDGEEDRCTLHETVPRIRSICCKSPMPRLISAARGMCRIAGRMSPLSSLWFR